MPAEIKAGAEDQGQRLDVFLADSLGSRSAAQRAIEEGRVRVDGEARPKRWSLSEGEIVSVAAQQVREFAEGDINSVTIVHQDDDLLVVDKPVGMVVHPAPGHPTGTLAQAVAGLSGGGEEGRIGIVHRLDRDTSGLLIVARNESSLRLLRSALQKREIERRYAALVLGHPRTLEGLVDAPIGRDRRHRTKISLHTDTPREARTRFRVEEDLPDSALLDVALETGRTHQIRVHLESIGLPVAGDPVYGSAGVFGLKRQFLHARSLSFSHPVSGELLTLQSPLPDDLEDALARARRGETP